MLVKDFNVGSGPAVIIAHNRKDHHRQCKISMYPYGYFLAEVVGG